MKDVLFNTRGVCARQDAKDVASILKGNTCGMKGTSCADQLAKAIEENL